MSRYLVQTLRYIVLIGLFVSTLGCVNENMDDLRAYVVKVKAKKGDAIEPLPILKSYESFKYVADDLRNPFVEKIELLVETGANKIVGPGPDRERAKEELESYPLDTLRMVGTLSKGRQLWGLVKASDGIIHRVKPGHYLGQNFGKVTQITEEQIDVDEFVSSSNGKWRERQAFLVLAE